MVRATQMAQKSENRADSNEPVIPASDAGGICKYFSECEFFNQPDVTGIIEAGLKHFYCFSSERWGECRRLRHFQETGENPPITMLPNGRVMPR